MMFIYTFVKYELLTHTKLGLEKTSLIMLLSFAHHCHGGVASAASDPPPASLSGRPIRVWYPAVVVPSQS